MSLEWTKSFINNAQANGSSIPDTTVSAVEEDKNIFEEVQTLNNQTNNKNDVSDDNKKDKDVFEAVSVKLLSSIFEKNYSMLNSPDSYGWTGELRNSIVEIFGYDVSFEDINAILDVQKRGIEVLQKAADGDLEKEELFEFSKEKLSIDPNYSLISDAIDYLPYNLVVDWAGNGIPEDINISLTCRTSDGFSSYVAGVEQKPWMMTSVTGITVYDKNSNVLYEKENTDYTNSDYTIDENSNIIYNDTLQIYELDKEEALKQADFKTVYKTTQGTEYSEEAILNYLYYADTMSSISEILEEINGFGKNIQQAQTMQDLINAFIKYYGSEELAIEQLNIYLNDSINPSEENFDSQEEYFKACFVVENSLSIGFENGITGFLVSANDDGSYGVHRTYKDGTVLDDDTALNNPFKAAPELLSNNYFYNKLNDSVKAAAQESIEDYTNEYQKAFLRLSLPAKDAEKLIQQYDAGEKNAVNVVSGITTTAAVLAALALSAETGGGSLALLGSAAAGTSTSLGSSMALAYAVGGSANTLIRGTNTASMGQKYGLGEGLRDFSAGGIHGATITAGMEVYKFTNILFKYGADLILTEAGMSSAAIYNIAHSSITPSAIRVLAGTYSGAVSGKFSGAVNAANYYLHYTDNFSLEGLGSAIDKGRSRGEAIGAVAGFLGSVLSKFIPNRSAAHNKANNGDYTLNNNEYSISDPIDDTVVQELASGNEIISISENMPSISGGAGGNLSANNAYLLPSAQEAASDAATQLSLEFGSSASSAGNSESLSDFPIEDTNIPKKPFDFGSDSSNETPAYQSSESSQTAQSAQTTYKEPNQNNPFEFVVEENKELSAAQNSSQGASQGSEGTTANEEYSSADSASQSGQNSASNSAHNSHNIPYNDTSAGLSGAAAGLSFADNGSVEEENEQKIAAGVETESDTQEISVITFEQEPLEYFKSYYGEESKYFQHAKQLLSNEKLVELIKDKKIDEMSMIRLFRSDETAFARLQDILADDNVIQLLKEGIPTRYIEYFSKFLTDDNLDNFHKFLADKKFSELLLNKKISIYDCENLITNYSDEQLENLKLLLLNDDLVELIGEKFNFNLVTDFLMLKGKDFEQAHTLLSNSKIIDLIKDGAISIYSIEVYSKLEGESFEQLQALLSNDNLLQLLKKDSNFSYCLENISKMPQDEFKNAIKIISNDDFINLVNKKSDNVEELGLFSEIYVLSKLNESTVDNLLNNLNRLVAICDDKYEIGINKLQTSDEVILTATKTFESSDNPESLKEHITPEEYSEYIIVTKTITMNSDGTLLKSTTYRDNAGNEESWYEGSDRVLIINKKTDPEYIHEYYKNEYKELATANLPVSDINYQIEIVNNKQGEPSYILYTKESPELAGAYETIRYNLKDYPEEMDVLSAIKDGTIEGGEKLSTVTKDGATIRYQENYERNGCKVNRDYTQQVDEQDKLSSYKYSYNIEDENGNALLTLNRSWIRNSDETTTTVINGKTYTASFNDETLEVKLLLDDGTERVINIKDKLAAFEEYDEEFNVNKEYVVNKYETEEAAQKAFFEFAKTLPADQLITIDNHVSKIFMTEALSSAIGREAEGKLYIGLNGAILSHEMGHGIDFEGIEPYTETNGLTATGKISSNPELIKLYNQEMEKFTKEYPQEAQNIIAYFTQTGGGNFFGINTNAGLSELVAETNMLMTTYGQSEKVVQTRSEYLVRYFPKTVAKIGELLEAQKADEISAAPKTKPETDTQPYMYDNGSKGLFGIAEDITTQTDETPSKNSIGLDEEETYKNITQKVLNNSEDEKITFTSEERAVVLKQLAKRYPNFDVSIINALDDKELSACLYVLTVNPEESFEYAYLYSKLDASQLNRIAFNNPDVIKEMVKLDDAILVRVSEIFSKNSNLSHAENLLDILKLDDTQYQKALTLLDDGFNIDSASLLSKVSDERYQKALDIVTNGKNNYLNNDDVAQYLSTFNDEQYEIFSNLADKITVDFALAKTNQLNSEQYSKLTMMLDKGIPSGLAFDFATSDDSEIYLRAIELSNRGASYYLKEWAMLEPQQYKRALELLDEGVPDGYITYIAKYNEVQTQRFEKYRYIDDSYINVQTIARLDDDEFAKFEEYLSKGITVNKSIRLALCSEDMISRINKFSQEYGIDIEDAVELVNKPDVDIKNRIELLSRGITYTEIWQIDLDGPYSEEDYSRLKQLLDNGVTFYQATQYIHDEAACSALLESLRRKPSAMRDFLNSDNYPSELKKATDGNYQSQLMKMLSPDTMPYALKKQLIESDLNTEDFINVVKKFKSTYKSAINTPNQYLSDIDTKYTDRTNGTYKTLLNVAESENPGITQRWQSEMAQFLEKNFVKIARALQYIDVDTVNQMMARRTKLFEESLDELYKLSDENFRLLGSLTKCKNEQTAERLTAKDKIQLCQIVEIYQKADLDVSNLLKMVQKGSVNLDSAKQEIQYAILKKAGITEDELATIPKDKLNFNEEYSYLALKGNAMQDTPAAASAHEIKEIKKQIAEYRAMDSYELDAAVRGFSEDAESGLRFHTYTQDEYNAYVEFINMLKNIEQYSDEELLNKTLEINGASVQKHDDNGNIYTVIRESALGNFDKFIFDESNIFGQTNAKTKAAYEAAGLNYDKWLNPDIKDVKIKVAGKELTIKLWDRNPQEDLFVGNKTSCCTAIGTGANGASTPIFLLNTSFNVVELYDNTGNVVGMSRVYMGKIDGKNALLMDSYELNKTFTKNLTTEQKGEIRDGFFRYMNIYARAVTGDKDAQVYLYPEGEEYRFPLNDLKTKEAVTEFVGNTSQDSVYINASHYEWINPQKMQELGEIKWLEAPIISPVAQVKLRNIASEMAEYLSSNNYTLNTLYEALKALGFTYKDAVLDELGNYRSQIDKGAVSARSKSADSIFSKLLRKIIDGEATPPHTMQEALKYIGDAQGLRIAMKNLEFSGKTNLTKSELEALQTAQNRIFVDAITEAILQDKLHISEIENYLGEDGIAYLTETDVGIINNAYKVWFDKKLKAVEDKIDTDFTIEYDENNQVHLKEVKSGKLYDDSVAICKTKYRKNGYTGANISFVNSEGQNVELQLRGACVDKVADAEHTIYDIKQGKETVSGREYDDIRKVVLKIYSAENSELAKAYDEYFKDVYSAAREIELGIRDNGDMPEIKNYKVLVENLSQAELDMISYEGVKKFVH